MVRSTTAAAFRCAEPWTTTYGMLRRAKGLRPPTPAWLQSRMAWTTWRRSIRTSSTSALSLCCGATVVSRVCAAIIVASTTAALSDGACTRTADCRTRWRCTSARSARSSAQRYASFFHKLCLVGRSDALADRLASSWPSTLQALRRQCRWERTRDPARSNGLRRRRPSWHGS